MALVITLPTGAYEQVNEQDGLSEQGRRTHTHVIKGPYSGLESLLRGLDTGDEISTGYYLSHGFLSRGAGNTGTLTLTCTPDDTDTSGSTPSQTALDETWTIKSVRNDMSILAYCGPSQSNPDRTYVEAWQKEPDGSIANANSFTKPDGSIVNLNNQSPASVALIGKIRKGIDSVMRFYPQLTKTRTYSKIPAKCYENLNTIDTPTVSDLTSKVVQKMSNFDEIVAAHTWLKCQDDVAKLGDGTFQRIESWMGVPNSNGSGWDENLYGTTNRWPMPYQAAN